MTPPLLTLISGFLAKYDQMDWAIYVAVMAVIFMLANPEKETP